MQPIELKPNHIVTGPLLPEPVKIIALVPMGDSVKLIGEGMHSGKVHQSVLTVDQIADLTVGFQIDEDELDFYDNLTRHVEDQSIRASQDDSARGRALGFTMAMLQRRFASSIYAVRRTLERMKAKREKILEDPEAYRQEQILKKVPDDFEDLPDEEQQEIMDRLESVVASIDPEDLRDDILELGKLADQARVLEGREIETKLNKLKGVITKGGIFQDQKMKILVFNCAVEPELHIIQDPARLGWKPIVKVEHYHVGAQDILRAEDPA